MRHNIKLYMQIIAKEVARYFTYRANLFSGALYAALSVAMRYALWRALYQTGNAQSVPFADTMTFFIISGALVNVFSAGVSDIIGPDIQSGDLAQRLSKPQSYQFTLVSLSHAHWITRLITQGAVMLIIGVFIIGIRMPPTPGALMGFLVSAALGNAVYLLIDLCISYSAFYFHDYWYISWFTTALMQLFGGVVLQLWFYPEALLRVAAVLPFRYIVAEPMDVYLGNAPAAATLAAQCGWIAALLGLERLIWRRVSRKLTVQGG